MRSNTIHPESRPARGATVLVVALICLLLVTVLTASLTRTVLLQRQQVLRDEWRLQAEWLAEAGIERAAARLNSDSSYYGEEWLPALNDEATPLGRVRISIAPEESGNGLSRLQIQVTADVPADTVERARVEQTTTMPIPAEEN